MQDHNNARRIPLGIVAAVSAVLVAVGGCSERQNSNSSQSATTTTPAPAASVSPSPVQPSTSVSPSAEPSTSGQTQFPPPLASRTSQSVNATNQKIVKVYWVNNVNQKIEVVPSTVTLKNAGKPTEILEGAFDSLLAGPTDPAVATTIPQGTKLRKLSVQPDGVHVDLSKEFTEGGGSASMTGRVAQVIYTASTLDPAAKVWIAVDGKPLEVLGGEGLMLDQPITRESFKQNFNL